MVEPGDGKPYDRDPRSIAKRAEVYLKASGLGDAGLTSARNPSSSSSTACAGRQRMGCSSRSRSRKAAWNTGRVRGGNRPPPTTKGGYFPVPPVDSTQDMRAGWC